MQQKITKAFVDKIGFEASGQVFYRDSELKGFGLRVGKTTKVYFAESKLDGRTIRKTIAKYNVISLEDARAQAKKILAEVANGKNPFDEVKARRANVITVKEVLDDYIATRVSLKPSSIQDYRQTFKTYLTDWQNKPLKQISKDMIQTRFLQIGESSPSQANKVMRNFRAIYNYAMVKYEDSQGESIFKSNPVKILSQLRMWYRVNRRNTLIKHYDLAPWYQAVMNLNNDQVAPNRETVRDFLLFVLLTGLRRREAAALTWNRVDFKGKTFTVIETKNHTDHTLPLTDYLFDLLVIRKSQAINQYVFPNEFGSGMLNDPKKQIKNVVDNSGVSFTTHDLRRTFITIAESLDIAAYSLKRLLNHKMTNDVTAGYIITDVERLRVPMQKITNYITAQFGIKESALILPIERKA
jgi:integrase